MAIDISKHYYKISLLLATVCFSISCTPGFEASSSSYLLEKTNFDSGFDNGDTPPVIPTPGQQKSKLNCDKSASQAISNFTKLTKYELTNTLQDIFGTRIGVNAVNEILKKYPDDITPSEEIFDNQIYVFTTDHIESLLQISKELAELAVNNESWVRENTNCNANENKSSCLDFFYDNYFLKVFRRPIAADEKSIFNSMANESNLKDNLTALIRMSLLSPHFINKVYLGNLDGGGATKKLSSYELVSKLYFTMLGRGPDLQALKQSSSYDNNKENYKNLVKRIVSDGRFLKHINYFFAQLYEYKQFFNPQYSSFELNGIAKDSLVNDLKNEAEGYIRYILFNKKGNFKDLMTSKAVSATSRNIASIYQVNQGSNISSTQQARGGMLGRAAYLYREINKPNIVHRGVFFNKNILCKNIPSPSSEVVNDPNFKPIEASPRLSARQQLEINTKPNTCFGCHTLINDPGFILENFDNLGRYRSIEKIYNDQNQIIAEHPVNAESSFTIDNQRHHLNNLSQLNNIIAESPEVMSCFSKNWYSFSMGQKAKQNSSQFCSVADAYNTLTVDSYFGDNFNPNEGLLLRMIQSVVFSDSFFKIRKR